MLSSKEVTFHRQKSFSLPEIRELLIFVDIWTLMAFSAMARNADMLLNTCKEIGLA